MACRYFLISSLYCYSTSREKRKKITVIEERETERERAQSVISLGFDIFSHFCLSTKQPKRRTEMKVNNEQRKHRSEGWRGIRTAVARNHAGVRRR